MGIAYEIEIKEAYKDSNNIEIQENILDVDTYLKLRDAVNWRKLTKRQAEMAVNNCLYSVVAYLDDEPVGMGRVVGDGAVICYIQDLIVVPNMHGKGIGTKIIIELIDYVKSITEEGSTMMLDLMSAVGRDTFYEKFGFISRPNSKLGPGMIQYIIK